ncbi:MAG: NAD(P)/FAD-dependent oxidoreductase [Cytophagales bacterium]|nr:NAD(P)/FAD-dependent oxidoreductase [Cytophagales bacterium]
MYQNRLNIPSTNQPRVVVIGGGFGGMQLIKSLYNSKVQLVLFDKHNYHTFQPLLYQVATAGLEPDAIAAPLRRILEECPDFYFRMAEVNHIHPEKNTISTTLGELDYDYLVIANGSKTNYFGNKSIQANSFPLKQIPQALDLRSHMLQNFEKAVLESDQEEQEALKNIVIVGGGPTGIEVAGALGELKKHVLPRDYPELDLKNMRIYLIEATSRLLGTMSEHASKKASQYLQHFEVQLILNKLVKHYDGKKVTLEDGTTLSSKVLIWAAGVKGNIIDGLRPEAIQNSRILVDAYNRVQGYEDIFAIGDVAAMVSEQHPKGHPMVAPVAIEQGKLLAKNLIRMVEEGKQLQPFKYIDKGSLATIGRNRAVVDFPGGIRFGGFFAWLIWMFVHLFSITGFRNKLVILANWIWNYFTYDRGTRLIIRPYIKFDHEEVERE